MTENEKEYIKQWLFRAGEDIAVIHALSIQNTELYASTICFHCQQAVEKYLKAFLVYKKIEFPKTHDVDFLLSKCISINPLLFEKFDFKNLTDFGVDIRYPDDFYIPEISETQEYIRISTEL
jgi:HEPN domain-containing protein